MTHATTEGTSRYRSRFAAELAPEHFRQAQGLWLSTIGLGTYLGDPDEKTDEAYRQSVKRAVELGCNVIDSAANYRFQRSERNIGEALEGLFAGGAAARDEVVVCTKGGYIPYDGQPPRSVRERDQYLARTFFEPGVATPADMVDASHCMTPSYLAHQLEQSRRNLRLETIDVYYIHNPEGQLGAIARDEFNRRLKAAFELLEERVAAGQIRFYGVATWNGFRQPPQARDHLSLAELAGIARKAGGRDHHFRFIQLPFNLYMPEALTATNQTLGREVLSTLDVARNLQITVVGSASLLQARLTQQLPGFIGEALTGTETDAQRAVQFARSTPGVTTALVGMSQIAHVEENLRLARIAPASTEQFLKLFTSSGE